MSRQMATLLEGFLAGGTCKWTLTSVDSDMFLQITSVLKTLATSDAFVQSRLRIGSIGIQADDS